MSTSLQTIEYIINLLKYVAKVAQPGLSQVAAAALGLNAAAQGNSEVYQQVAADACRFVFVVADQLRQKGNRNIDNDLKGNLESVASIFGEIQSLTQPSTPQNAFSAFWGSSSDSEDLETLKMKLEQSLRAFNIQDFSELRRNADQRVKALKASSSTSINNNNIAQRDGGTVHTGNHYGPQMFAHANGFKIEGGEFNNVGCNINKATYHGKNIAANYGKLYGQNVGDYGGVNFNGFPG